MIEIMSRDNRRELVIECPNRCAWKGCQHDENGEEWRESVRLSKDTSIDYARVLLERHEHQHPTSGPYRLVEYVTESKTTREVLS